VCNGTQEECVLQSLSKIIGKFEISLLAILYG